MAAPRDQVKDHDAAVDFDWIDEIADRFDAAWKQGPRPRIGHFLVQIAGERRAALIEELVKIDLEYRSRAGEKPCPENYLSEFPELLGPDGSIPNCLILYARQVRQKYADAPNAGEFQTGSWDLADGPSRPVRCPNCRNLVPLVDGEVKDLTCPNCGNSFRVQPGGPSVFRSADLPRTLGKFQLLELVGEGSFGTVYKARDAELDRIVAVKVPRSGYFVSAEDNLRFAREARSAARLLHPNIVQVHEIAHEGDMPYIVSDFVAGPTLAQLLADHRPSFRESAELAAQIADALAFAHERKVIHRDVNPRNIMLETGGVVNGGLVSGTAPDEKQATQRPTTHHSPLTTHHALLTDFGLARRDEGSVAVTLDGKILGTPAYMAPEQAAGNPSHVGAAADIYALGVVLYEMLTGEPPFRGNVRMVLHQVLNDEPRPPRRLNDRIPRDLETVCLKALAKEPGRRYASAAEFSADLRRYLAGEPILARPPGVWERGLKWVKRRPALAALLAVSTATVTGLLGFVIYAVDLQGRIEVAEANERAAQVEKEAAATAASLAQVSRGLLLLEKENAVGLLDLLEARRRVDDIPKARESLNLLWSGWYAGYGNRQRQVFSHKEALANIAISADGKIIGTASKDRTAQVWNWETGLPVGTPFPQWVGSYAPLWLSPDGKYLANQPEAGSLQIWEIASGKLFGRKIPQAAGMVFSPKGQKVAIECGTEQSPKVELLDLGAEPSDALILPNALGPMAFSPDGELLTTSLFNNGSSLRLWDTETGLPRGESMRHDGHITCITWSKDSRTLATGSNDHTVRMWDATTGEPVTAPLEHPENVHAVGFSPDGKVLATGCYDGWVRLWGTSTGKPLRPMRHDGAVLSVEFSPNGELLATGSMDGTARLWRVETAESFRWPMHHQGIVFAVRFHPDGKHLITASSDGTARAWAIPGSGEKALEHPDRVWSVDFSPDGRLLASGCEDGSARLWKIDPGNQISKSVPLPARRPGENQKVLAVAFDPEQKALAAGGDEFIQFYSLPTLSVKGTPFQTGTDIRALAFRPDGELLVGAGMGTIHFGDLATGKLLDETVHQEGEIYCMAMNPDGRLVAVGTGAGFAQIWDTAARKPHGPPLHHGSLVEALAFSPDGELLATASRDMTVRFWNPSTCERVGQAFQLQSPVQAMAFHPKEKLLALGYTDGTVRLVDLATGLPCGPPIKHKHFVTSVAFSKDGKLLASGSFDKRARISHVPDLITDLHELELRTWVALGARLTESGTVEPIPWQEWQGFREELLEIERRSGSQK